MAARTSARPQQRRRSPGCGGRDWARRDQGSTSHLPMAMDTVLQP
jgi:hypothetical protein